MRLLAVVLLVLQAVAVVSAFYVIRTDRDSTPSSSSNLIRLRRSGILFGKLARNWAADDKRVVLRPLVEYEPDPWH